MRQRFDEDEVVSNNMLVFCEEQLERNESQETVFPYTSVEELRYQQRRNRILCIIQLLWLWWNGFIDRRYFE